VIRQLYILFILTLSLSLGGCGIYSFTGASINGKTINLHTLDNRARNVVPTLNTTLTDKIRARILSQTGLSPVNNDKADYDITGTINAYDIIVSQRFSHTQTATVQFFCKKNILSYYIKDNSFSCLLA
jgi:hypothetical protein